MSEHLKDDVPLIEIGWEVCNRVGGIYTVLRTKALQMVAQRGDAYALLGPLNSSSAQVEFESVSVPPHLAAGVEALQNAGIHCLAGRWLVCGSVGAAYRVGYAGRKRVVARIATRHLSHRPRRRLQYL